MDQLTFTLFWRRKKLVSQERIQNSLEHEKVNKIKLVNQVRVIALAKVSSKAETDIRYRSNK